METVETTEMPGKARQCPVCKKQYPADYEFCPDDAARLVYDAATAQSGTSELGMTEEPANQISNPHTDQFAAKFSTQPFFKESLIGLAAALVVIGAVIVVVIHHSQSMYQSKPVQTPTASASSSLTAAANVAESNMSPATPSSSGFPTENTVPGNGASGPWRRYENASLGFSMEYPVDWTAAAPTYDGTSILVLFRSPDPHIVLLVDVDSPASGSRPLARWQQFDKRFAHAYKERYHLMSLGDAQLGGSPAARWQFTVEKKQGPILEKVDTGATHGDRDFALLGAAPVASFPEWQDIFVHAAQSFTWTH